MELEPDTRFAKVGDDRIAYQVFGQGPPDLVYFSGIVSNVDLRWEEAVQARWLRGLASFSRVIMFDKRGFGVSDPISDRGGSVWEQWADDVRAVMDACGSERAAVFGVIDAGASAVLFAATYPERTAALILSDTTARWVAAPDYPEGLAPEVADRLVSLIADLWGREEAADVMLPSLAGDAAVRRWWARFMRGSTRPRDVALALGDLLEADVREVLPLIAVPTLVLHGERYTFVPAGQARYLAEHIAGARFVDFPGVDSTTLAPAQSQDAVLDVVQEFLTGARRKIEIDRVLATVLFTDIASSTNRAALVGDREWKALLDAHDGIVRDEVARHRGRVVKTTGDGALSTFDGPARAVRCAVATGERLRSIGLEIRAGLHTGEIELRGASDVGGIAVHIAARVMAAARPGEVLVSGSVPPLVVGSGITFDERGVHVLKGVPGRWRTFAVKTS